MASFGSFARCSALGAPTRSPAPCSPSGTKMSSRRTRLASRQTAAILLAVVVVLSGCSDGDVHNRTLYRAMDACKKEVDRFATVARTRTPTILIGYYDEDTIANGNARTAATGCLLNQFGAPNELYFRIAQTNSAQGPQVAEWSTYRIAWAISRRDGFQAVIGRRGIPSDVTVNYRYP